MSNLMKLEADAIKRLKAFEPADGYYGCYSGGKDSDVIKILLKLADVKHEMHHNITTVDAPETMRYIFSQKDIIMHHPEKTMWKLIVEKGMPPTRLVRYCCEELKEKGGKGRVKVTGVRWAESTSRKESADVARIIGKPKSTQKLADEIGANYRVNRHGGVVLNDDNDESRRMVEQCYRTRSTMVNPIVDWSDADVWQFLHHYGCESNPLYKQGQCRIGCIGCPLSQAKQQKADFERYPRYRALYVKAFDKMIERRISEGKDCYSWHTGEDVMTWWLGDDPNQIMFDI